MQGQLLHYASRLDRQLQPLPVCTTDDSKQPKALILDLSPGAIANLDSSVRACERYARLAKEEGVECVVAKPCGRGPGSVYQGPGEVDVFEAIEALCGVFEIDRERISVMGGSMGGAATWYIASHYPDQFAAAAPFCGYCDYRLWTKPGGYIMRMFPWEEYSWQSRGAAFRAENLSNMGIWITHGEWDIGIGGGVPVQHSRSMSQALGQLGIRHEYVEVPKCGHGCMSDDSLRPVLAWLPKQRRKENPNHIRLVVHSLRHNRSHWLAVEQLEQYGAPGRAEAKFQRGSKLTLKTENVRRLTLGPSAGRKAVQLVLDGQTFPRVSISRKSVTFGKKDGQWQRDAASSVTPGEKRHGASGPASDLFFEPLRMVKGTHGCDHENFLINWMAGGLPGTFKQRNGGVHRGIFDGESYYDIPLVNDTKLSDEELENCNLSLLGTFKSNKVLSRFKGELPLGFGKGRIEVGGKTYRGENLGVSACFPSPANPERLLLVTGGVTPEAITGATHFGLQLLPDYLVWDGDQVLDYGFFGNDWQAG